MKVTLPEIMSFVRFHTAMHERLRTITLPEANRSLDASKRSYTMKSLNHHGREGYKLATLARSMMQQNITETEI